MKKIFLIHEHGKSKFPLLLLVLFLLIVALVVWLVFFNPSHKKGPTEDQSQASIQSQGEQYEFSKFYHADNGTWVIEDEDILVLKEMKYISASEKDEYTVHKVNPSDHVRIIEAPQRWKRVEILDQGEVIATGWIDAHHVRNAKRIDVKNQNDMK